MKICHVRNRNGELEKSLPSVGDQLDAMWAILNTLAPEAVAASPVYQAIQDVKYSRFPKNPTPQPITAPTLEVNRGTDSPTGIRAGVNRGKS